MIKHLWEMRRSPTAAHARSRRPRRTPAAALAVAASAAALLISLLPSAEATSTAQSAPLIVPTRSGQVEGAEADGAQVFRDIPYAAPPVGALRWKPPQPPASWPGVRPAEEYGPECLQAAATVPGNGDETATASEDCLTLNVNRPVASDVKLPVMVWIHGGGLGHGTGNLPGYNTSAIPKQGVILVTFNYRLGNLGFFAASGLADEQTVPVADFGMMDQIAALQWVHDNIRAFGGDPANVTVFGESAGGLSVNNLMASPLAHGLFDKAITQSGLGREQPKTMTQARQSGDAFVSSLGVDPTDPAALRSIPADQVMSGPPPNILAGDAPIIDGTVLTEPVSQTFAAGRETRVPQLIGTTDLEFPMDLINQAGLAPKLGTLQLTASEKASLLAAYGSSTEMDEHLDSDIIFTEPAHQLACEHRNVAPVYAYRFGIVLQSEASFLQGAPHTSDVPFVFQSLNEDGTKYPATETEVALSATISAYWVAFARTGSPNGTNRLAWPVFDGKHIMTFTNNGPQPQADPWLSRLHAVGQTYADGTPPLAPPTAQ